MTKLLIFLGMFIGGWILGDLIGGFGWAFALSSIGSLAGVIIGWKIDNEWF